MNRRRFLFGCFAAPFLGLLKPFKAKAAKPEPLDLYWSHVPNDSDTLWYYGTDNRPDTQAILDGIEAE